MERLFTNGKMEKGLEPGLIKLLATDIHPDRAHQHQYSQTDSNCIDQPCTEQPARHFFNLKCDVARLYPPFTQCMVHLIMPIGQKTIPPSLPKTQHEP